MSSNDFQNSQSRIRQGPALFLYILGYSKLPLYHKIHHSYPLFCRMQTSTPCPDWDALEFVYLEMDMKGCFLESVCQKIVNFGGNMDPLIFSFLVLPFALLNLHYFCYSHSYPYEQSNAITVKCIMKNLHRFTKTRHSRGKVSANALFVQE